MPGFQRVLRCELLAVSLAVGMAACDPPGGSPPDPGPGKKRPAVSVVNYPLRYFAERIGGELVDVRFPAPADVDPAFWRPSAGTVLSYQDADLILLNGAGYARWIEGATLRREKLVNTSRAFENRYIKLEDEVTHSHGPEGDHSHSGLAFTTWLDPQLAREQARAIQAALASLMPEQEKALQAGLEELEVQLGELDRRIQELVSRKARQPLLASHPVYQYLARRYGLNLRSVHWEPDETPGPEMWEELKRILEEHGARWMLWEAEPLESAVKRLRELGVESVVFSPCGNVPPEGDFLSVMEKNLENLKPVFEP